MISAAVVSSLRGVADAAARDARGVSVGSPSTSGMTATPVSKPESPSASLGKTSRATPTISQRVAVLGEERVPASRRATCGCAATRYRPTADDDGVEREVDRRPAPRRCRSPP